MIEMKIAELILDYRLYPRTTIDATHVRYMVEALQAGKILPPIKADKGSKRVTDGFHRYSAHRQFSGDDATIKVIAFPYKDEQEMFRDAMFLNAGHGRALTKNDRTHCLLVAEKLKMSMDQVSDALCLTVDALKKMRTDRVGVVKVDKRGRKTERALKQTIGYKAGQLLTPDQWEANDKLGGMNASYYANQLILLLENDLLDETNEYLAQRLGVLRDLLNRIPA